MKNMLWQMNMNLMKMVVCAKIVKTYEQKRKTNYDITKNKRTSKRPSNKNAKYNK